MEVLESFDLTGSFRDAAELAGCSHHTVARYVASREAGGQLDKAAARPQLIDEFLPKVQEWVTSSKGKIRADKAHEKLLALGFKGSERTTRRAVREAKAEYNLGQVRVHRPWVTEPGMWLQYDFGDGPVIDGRKTVLFCVWLAWSRFRVVLALRDRTAPTVFAALDVTLRRLGGAPTYALTDNEKTVTTGRVAGIALRHPDIVAAARHYGCVIHTCQSADPESKGGVEATVRIAKADIVPTTANLRAAYDSFSELEGACQDAMDRFNAREHRETRRAPDDMIAEERLRLHPVPSHAHTLAFGEARTVDRDSTIRYGSARYSVPHTLVGEKVWARVSGDELVLVDVAPAGAREVARHKLTTPGNPRIDDAHYPERTTDPLNPRPRPKSAHERAFLALGDGAEQWLIEAAATGVQRVRTKMTEATELATLVGADVVNRALGLAAASTRFATGDLASIVDHLAHGQTSLYDAVIADPAANLGHGTGAWEGLGR